MKFGVLENFGFFSAGLPGRREIIMEIIKVLCRGALPPEPPVPPASRPATPVQADLSAGRWPAAGRPVGKARVSPRIEGR